MQLALLERLNRLVLGVFLLIWVIPASADECDLGPFYDSYSTPWQSNVYYVLEARIDVGCFIGLLAYAEGSHYNRSARARIEWAPRPAFAIPEGEVSAPFAMTSPSVPM